MFCVFNANLLTDMGKTIVRKHLNTTDAQAVWQELSDNFKGSTEQFVLHFNEQLRQLDEISDDSEKSHHQ